MKIDPKFSLLALAVSLAAAQPFAQQTQEGIARLTDVHGNVLVSRDTGLAAGSNATRLMDGMRVITTSHSGAVVEYDDGCRVELKENQRVVIERDRPCAALLAAVESIVEPSVALAAAPGLGLTPGTLVQAGLVGVGVWRWNQGEPAPAPTPVSPN
jgi:hypothetical protein